MVLTLNNAIAKFYAVITRKIAEDIIHKQGTKIHAICSNKCTRLCRRLGRDTVATNNLSPKFIYSKFVRETGTVQQAGFQDQVHDLMKFKLL